MSQLHQPQQLQDIERHVRLLWGELDVYSRELEDEADRLEEAYRRIAAMHEQNAAEIEALEGRDEFSFVEPDTHILLNVGGQLFETSAGVLCRDRFSVLAALCTTDPPAVPDEDTGAFFIDRDWWIFRHIMLFLREGYLPSDRLVLEQLYTEASFYRLHSLRTAIENMPASKVRHYYTNSQHHQNELRTAQRPPVSQGGDAPRSVLPPQIQTSIAGGPAASAGVTFSPIPPVPVVDQHYRHRSQQQQQQQHTRFPPAQQPQHPQPAPGSSSMMSISQTAYQYRPYLSAYLEQPPHNLYMADPSGELPDPYMFTKKSVREAAQKTQPGSAGADASGEEHKQHG